MPSSTAPQGEPAPVRTSCPRCHTPCAIAPGHLAGPVRCPHCGAAFTVRPTTPGRTEAPRALRLDIGAATSAGRVRDRNEDSFLVQHVAWSNLDRRHELAVLLVADGMGGHSAGDRASGLMVRVVAASLAPALSAVLAGQLPDPPGPFLAGAVESALQEANRAVFAKSQADPACKGMGATAALALVWDAQVVLAHAGDCRAYHWRAGQLTQLTRDQTLVARLVELGQLTEAQARNHPSANQVTQAVGWRAELAPSRQQLTLAAGDWLVLACDGLHAHLDGEALEASFVHAPASAAQLAEALVECANEAGGSDNCTAVVLRAV